MRQWPKPTLCNFFALKWLDSESWRHAKILFLHCTVSKVIDLEQKVVLWDNYRLEKIIAWCPNCSVLDLKITCIDERNLTFLLVFFTSPLSSESSVGSFSVNLSPLHCCTFRWSHFCTWEISIFVFSSSFENLKKAVSVLPVPIWMIETLLCGIRDHTEWGDPGAFDKKIFDQILLLEIIISLYWFQGELFVLWHLQIKKAKADHEPSELITIHIWSPVST